MPGGKGKIRPEDGKQFSTEYQPEEKWTEEVALQLAKDLIAWQKKDAINIFWEEYLIMERDLYYTVIAYLCKKFTSFSTLIDQARRIQEMKLQKYGTADKLNATMTKFVLINKHNWKDKQEIEHSGELGTYDVTEARSKLIERLTSDKDKGTDK